jgi:hypothetical protein
VDSLCIILYMIYNEFSENCACFTANVKDVF